MTSTKTKAALKQGNDFPTTKPCAVPLVRMTPRDIMQVMRELKAPTRPKPEEVREALYTLRRRGLVAEPVAEVIEISSEDEGHTPPRPLKKARGEAATPSPIVSPISCHDSGSRFAPHGDWDWLTQSPVGTQPNGLPITPGKNLLVTSPSSTVVGSPGNDLIFIENILGNEESPTRQTVRNEPKIRCKIVVPEKVEEEVGFACKEKLPLDISRGLQPYLKSAIALHRPGEQYKRVVTVQGRQFRILVGRKNHIVVIPRD